MESNQTAAPGFWRYLINPDKSATPQLEQLCLGLAKIIPTLEHGPDDELTPQRLAAFYRAVGGNYDSLFLKTSDHGLSFMYQTLGCFHSLQPTGSPFETPRIPCLTPGGFARWQTIQILLSPDENIGFLQKAVQKWNVLTPSGSPFPRYIPKDVFPDRPDEEMENWHRMVTGQLNQKNYNIRRIKNSPYQSPHPEAHDRRDGYFPSAQNGRPLHPSRSRSREDADHLTALHRRRSSVPDFPSPPGDRGSHWDPRQSYEARKARSHSAQRPPVQSSPRQRAKTAGQASNHPPKASAGSPTHARPSVGAAERSARRSSAYNTNYRSPAHTPSTVDEDSGSEASSENSHVGRRHRTSDEDRKGLRNSLWMPSFLRSHKRRHSSDASSRASAPKPTRPSRPEYYPPRTNNPSGHTQPSTHRSAGGPHWRDPNWDSDPAHSNPDTPTQSHGPNEGRPPTIRFPDQPNTELLPRDPSSGSGTDHRHRSSDWERGGAHRRQSHTATRMATVTGVQGRKYPTTDPTSPIDRQRGSIPTRNGVASAV